MISDINSCSIARASQKKRGIGDFNARVHLMTYGMRTLMVSEPKKVIVSTDPVISTLTL